MTVTDLGEEWYLRTQKPFVFAVWMARYVPVAREIEHDLLAAKNEGVKHFEEIVDNYTGHLGVPPHQAKEYLEKNSPIRYGPEEVKGQMEFQTAVERRRTDSLT